MRKKRSCPPPVAAAAVFFFLSLFQFAPLFADCDGYGSDQCRIRIDLHKSHVQTTDRDITRAAVADPDIADIQVITPRQILLISKGKTGATNLIVWHGDDHADLYEVTVAIPDAYYTAIQNRIDRLVPDADIDVVPGAQGVLLSGRVESLRMLESVLSSVESFGVPYENLITVAASQQVQLEVTVAEISKSGAKQMGLGFLNNSDLSIGLFSSGSVTGNMTGSETVVPESSYTTINTLTGIVTQYTNKGGTSKDLSSEMELFSPFASAFQLAIQGNDAMGILSVLKGQGLARVLATPTLVAMSGQEAEFLVGGEFPVPIQDDDAATIQFKEFGVLLRFTPMVVDRETITIQVAPEVSTVDYSLSVYSGGVAVPGIKTRRGATTLQLKDGQSFIMAGLLSEEVSSNTSKVPFLGDIPILGTLFTSKEFQKNETELMILVTPRLVRALNPDETPALPGEDHAANVGDADFFLLNRRLDLEPTTGNPEFHGATGFVK